MTEGNTVQPVNVYTDEKAKRLMRTFGASLAFSFLVVWIDIVILRQAVGMAREMVCFLYCKSLRLIYVLKVRSSSSFPRIYFHGN